MYINQQHMTKILVTGGAGYIGSHTMIDLIDAGFDVVSIDNFINSNADTYTKVKNITHKNILSYDTDLCNLEELDSIFSQNHFAAIIHFAALKSVGDSVENPLLYYRNNLVGLINLLQLQKKYTIKNLIFSSSCSVYGNAEKLPVTETTPLKEAESPYARTKQICEEIIT